MNKFLSIALTIAFCASMSMAVVIEDFESWTGVGTPVADPDNAANTVLALAPGEVLELATPESEGVVSMDIYDFGQAAVYNAYGPKWCVEGTLLSDGSACSIGVGLIYRSYMNCNMGYAMGYETNRTGAWYSPSFFGESRQCTLETWLDTDGDDIGDDDQNDGAGAWTTWSIEALSNGTAEISATLDGADIVQNAWWNGDPMVLENMDKVWVSGGQSGDTFAQVGGAYDGYSILVDNIVMGSEPTPCPGDIDGDGDVDIFDFLVLKANYGTASGATWAMGDLDGDGDVDIFDFLILKANYGNTCE